VTVFVPGVLKNPLNGSWGGWRKHARLARDWRERTAVQLYMDAAVHPWTPAFLAAPKRVTFTAHVGRLWDDDNIPGAVKPVRDQVAASCCGGDDGPKSGHLFLYEQRVDTQRGVLVRVEALTP
jgi:hypothetical protein